MGWFGRSRAKSNQPANTPHPNAPLKKFSANGVIGIADVLSVLENSDQKISRTEALSVPAVTRGRNLICSISTLPLQLLRLADHVVIDNALLRQIDPDTPNVTTLAQTVEDLLLESVSWWRITSTDFDGFPASARRMDPATVSVNPPSSGRTPAPLPSGTDPRDAVVYVDGRPVSAREVIRFDSPNPPILVVGARVIRRAILLDKAAKMYADDPRPLDYFVEKPDATPLEDEEINNFLAGWVARRKKRATGYINKAVDYQTVDGPSPQQLQLVELQKQASLEIANLFGIDPEEVGQNVTSRTYFNAQDRRMTRINDVLAPFTVAIAQRLSMGDVTRRGYEVRFDFTDYLKADPSTRATVQRQYLDMGVITPDEIRAAEGLPGPAPTREPEPAPEPQEESTVDANQPPGYTFTGSTQFVDIPLETFSVDKETRTIEGTALPYGKSAKGIRFEQGALKFSDVSRVKLNMDHDPSKAVGVATDVKDSSKGLYIRFKITRTPEGDRALTLAEDRVYDGFSVEVDFDQRQDTIPDPRHKTGLLVRRADLRGVALTSIPAFDDARVTKVAASLTEGKTVTDTDTTPATTPEPAQVPATLTIDQVMALFSAMNTGSNTTTTMVPFQAEKVMAPVSQVISQNGERQFVNPLRPIAVTTVTDPVSYRFDRRGELQPAAHDFGVDLVRAAKDGRPDSPEYRRCMEFMRAMFDIQTGDVNELNPTINVPRYIDEREFRYPIWNSVNRGAPQNGVQPFSWPKFSSASGLVADHVETVEPTTGSYVTTSQTVTPAALSGKATVTRETWDMGGTPGLSNLIWTRITRDWFETLEAKITAELDNASPTSLGLFTPGGGTGHATLVQEMRRHLARLQFVRGGFRFNNTFAHQDLYTHLVDSFDTTGRPFFPMVNPQNADGSASSEWGQLTVGGVPFLPAWSLGASGTVSESSYLIDNTAVDGWATAPQRLTFDQTEVRYVHIAVWGYWATAINDINGVREVIYDPVA